MATSDPEQRHARIATISALLVVAAFVAGKAARDAILLAQFSIESLPLFIGLSAALALPVILVAGRLMHRLGPARLVPVMNVISAGLAIGEWVLLASYPRPVAIVVFFHLSTASAVLVSGFWSIVNERFDIQSAKRHIGRIGVGATLGGIAGGVVAERTAVYLEPNAILLVIAALQLVCAAMLYGFGRGAVPRPAEVHPQAGMWSALGVVSRSKLLRSVGVIVVLTAVAGGVLDYVFKADIVHGGSKEGLLRSLAVFYTVTNVVTAIVQISVCGPIISRLGVPRSVATLPLAVTAFSVVALAVPAAAPAAIARAAEFVTRNSVYRAGYELLYAPLPEDQKRSTKVMLDVGADKLGDIFGAQLVAAIVFVAVDVRTGLLIATLAVTAVALLVAVGLPRTYSKALEQSLLSHAADEGVASAPAAPAQPAPWITLSGLPRLGDPGDVVPVRLRGLRRRPRAASPGAPGRDVIADTLGDLRSGDLVRIRRALASPLPVALAGHAIELVGRDEVARAAIDALSQIAAKCTGTLVDALLDTERAPRLRGRLAAVLLHGEPQLATWGLWRGLKDSEFEVRYRCGSVLARLAADGHFTSVSAEEVFEAVRHELVADGDEWKGRQLDRDLASVAAPAGDDAELGAETGLEHVFRMLGLVLPAEPLRIALRAVQTDDDSLRGTALEYLESILPADVRARLWPLLEHADDGAAAALSDAVPELAEQAATTPPPEVVPEPVPVPRKRSRDELADDLRTSYPRIIERLKPRAKPPS